MTRREPKRVIKTYVTVKGLGKFGGRTVDSRTGEERRCTRETAAEAAKCAREAADRQR